MSDLYSPTGIKIIGTLETVSGCAAILGAKRDGDGSFDIEWAGDTEIYWDEQKTQTSPGGDRLFVDEDGQTWIESELELGEPT